MKLIPNEQQVDIYRSWKEENSNLLIQAGPGCGKTTTLMELVSIHKRRTLYLAFNNQTCKEANTKFKSKGLAKYGKAVTMHSLGFTTLKKHHKKIKLEKNKHWNILSDLQDTSVYQSVLKYLTYKEKYQVNYFLSHLSNTSRYFLTEDLKTIYFHMKNMGINRPKKLPLTFYKVWKKYLEIREETYNAERLVIDYIDMIYLPVKWKLDVALKPTYVLIDEAQDLSWLQHEFLNMLLSQPQLVKWAAVGDKNQSIYNFAGSYVEAFDLFVKKPNVKTFPLDICYRCPTSVVDNATKDNELTLQYGNMNPGVVDVTEFIEDIVDEGLVLCRNTKPLVKLLFKLIGNREVYIRGDDFLPKIRKLLKPYNKMSVERAFNLLDKKVLKMTQEAEEDALWEVDNFKSLYETVISFSEGFFLKTENILVREFVTKIETVFKPKKGSIILSTIHKAKGTEADNVYLLNRNLIPHKFARTKEQKQQEMNLLWVAETRSKKTFTYINLEEKKK